MPYTGSATSSEDLAAFVIAESMPLTLPFTAANTDKIFSSGIPRHVLIIASPADLAKGSALMKEFNGVAKALKGKFVFVTVDAESEDAEPVFNFFSLARDALPTVVGFVVRALSPRLILFVAPALTLSCASHLLLFVVHASKGGVEGKLRFRVYGLSPLTSQSAHSLSRMHHTWPVRALTPSRRSLASRRHT